MKNPGMESVVSADKKNVWHHLFQHAAHDNAPPVVMVEGNGLRITDAEGKTYLDAVAGGVWTVNVGYGRESIAKAIYEQLIKLPFYAGLNGTVPAALLSEKMLELLPHMGKVYFSNSGSEANEKAYKMVRQKAHLENDGKKHTIVFRDRDYHGTTIAALSSSGHQQRKQMYGPFVDGFVEMPHCCCYRCPYNKKYPDCNIECANELENIIQREGEENIGSVVLEPITAGGGIIPPVKEYLPIIQKICKKYDVLLHIDEVVCGIGRTGRWFGYQHYDIEPDIITMAKGVASGYAAISLTATTDDIFNLFKTKADDPMSYFRDISTFGGCTAGPTAALENIRIIEDEDLIKNCQVQGDYLLSKLTEIKEKHPNVGDARGKGLLAGIEMVEDKTSKIPLDEKKVKQIILGCKKEGVLIGATNRSLPGFNNTLNFSPALICTKSDIDEITRALDKAIGVACGSE